VEEGRARSVALRRLVEGEKSVGPFLRQRTEPLLRHVRAAHAYRPDVGRRPCLAP
jgi:hypothetical protein